MPAKKTEISDEKRELLKLCHDVLEDRKAGSLVILDVRVQSSITDFFVIATATSDPHLRAMRGELDKVFKANKIQLIGVDAEAGSGWTVIDAFDVMIHLFTQETRDLYRLETLWKDARVIEEADLEPPKVKKTRAVKRKAPVKKTAAKKAVARKAPAKKAPAAKKTVKKAAKKALKKPAAKKTAGGKSSKKA